MCPLLNSDLNDKPHPQTHYCIFILMKTGDGYFDELSLGGVFKGIEKDYIHKKFLTYSNNDLHNIHKYSHLSRLHYSIRSFGI